jgi:hypothetical protein
MLGGVERALTTRLVMSGSGPEGKDMPDNPPSQGALKRHAHVPLNTYREAFSTWEVANLLGMKVACVPSCDPLAVKRQTGVTYDSGSDGSLPAMCRLT